MKLHGREIDDRVAALSEADVLTGAARRFHRSVTRSLSPSRPQSSDIGIEIGLIIYSVRGFGFSYQSNRQSLGPSCGAPTAPLSVGLGRTCNTVINS